MSRSADGRRSASPLLTGLILMGTVVALVSTWTRITRDAGALQLAGGVALAVLGIGLLLRALRAPEWLAVLAELAGLTALLLWLAESAGDWARLPELLRRGGAHLVASVAPVPPHAGTTLLLVLMVGLLALLADWLAIALERPMTAVAPLLVLLLAPSLGPRTHTPPAAGIAYFAIGLALLLLVSRRRPVAGGSAVLAGIGLTGTAALVTAAALTLTVAVSPRVPVPPSARGTDGEPITMTDVSLDLKRNISRGANEPALRYSTTGEEGAYLRLYSLPTFNDQGWHLTSSTVQLGGIAPPPGLGQGTPRTTRVTITGLESEWLPAPYAARSHTAGDGWGYLPDQLAVLALATPDRVTATAGLTYTVQSVDARPTPEQLRTVRAGARPPSGADATGSVPADVPASIVSLTRRVTAGADTPGEKIGAILGYLNPTPQQVAAGSPRFRYSLDAAPDSGYPGLERFLLQDHTGFCVQYATSMALMARIAGIPSRVAIGFTPGTRSGAEWQVTMHDMHSWPELYLDGWGWVSFEPTPGIGADRTSSTASPSPTPSRTPSAAPTSAPATGQATPTPTPSSAAIQPVEPGVPSWAGTLGWVALAAALGAALLCGPALVRARRRDVRLGRWDDGAAGALAAWAELRDAARDLGRSWPEGSPRFVAEVVRTWFLRPESADGVAELALAVEQATYGGPAHAPSGRDWAGVVRTAERELAAQASGRRRLRAVLLPASLFGR